MERDEGGELDRLRSFVEGEIPGVSTMSASVLCTISIVEKKLMDLSVGLRRKRVGDHLVCDGRDTKILMLNFRFRVQDVILEAFEMLVVCPTLTDLSLSFLSQYIPIFDGVVLDLFAVVRRSRILYAFSISFMFPRYRGNLSDHVRGFFHKDLPILLRDNPSFQKLTFYLGCSADSLSYCFTRNPNLNSCALTISRYSKPDKHCCIPLEGIWLLTPVEQREPLNVEVLRELVIKTNPLDRRCGSCKEAIASLVRHNFTLERLEVDEYLLHYKDISCSIARALACNRSLQTLEFRCTTADIKQLLRSFARYPTYYRTNTSLSTLKLSLPKKTEVKDCMTVLGQLVGSETTLKHVELSLDLLNARRREKDRQRRIRGKLEQMLNNELGRNTCLQSLCVGSWQLVRVGAGDEWAMSFEGPCLGLKDSYVVKIKM